MITKEQVLAKAKELGIEVSDAEADVFVKLGVLPTKESDNTPGVQERISQLVSQRKAAQAELETAKATLAKLQEAQQAADQKGLEAKGEWEKLVKTADERQAAAIAAIAKAKDTIRTASTREALRTALVAFGLFNGVEESKRAARLQAATQLFPVDKVPFTWTDEEGMLCEVGDMTAAMEEFKKANDFLFLGETGGSGTPPQGRKPGDPPKPETPEERKARLVKQFPALGM